MDTAFLIGIMLVCLILLLYTDWRGLKKKRKIRRQEKEIRQQREERMLTEWDMCGNWCVKGLPWKDLHVGAVITENTYEKIYGALLKLTDYERYGLTPGEIEDLRDRDVAVPVKERYIEKQGERVLAGYVCPNGCKIELKPSDRFCPMCGQRLSW